MGKNDNVKKEKTTRYLQLLNEDGLQNIRRRFSEESELILDRKAHPMAGPLLGILCDPEVVKSLNADHFIRIAEAIFPAGLLGEEWFVKYCDYLIRLIDSAKNSSNGKMDSRADKYEKDLRGRLLPLIAQSSKSHDLLDDQTFLEDIYKVAVCLYRYYTTEEDKFSFIADRDSMDRLNKAIPRLKGTGNQVLGIVVDPIRLEDCQYAVFFSWVLEELLFQQVSLKEGCV